MILGMELTSMSKMKEIRIIKMTGVRIISMLRRGADIFMVGLLVMISVIVISLWFGLSYYLLIVPMMQYFASSKDPS